MAISRAKRSRSGKRGLVIRLVFVLLLAGVATAQAQPVFDTSTVGGPRSARPGELFLPAGRGPFPAMIVLHGCDGVGPHYRTWARRLQAWGYAALMVDSFGPRGIREVCGEGRRVDPSARAADAFRAAAWLRTRSDIAADEIGVIGFSHGGWSVLKAVLADAVSASGGPAFAAAVAYYPGCEAPGAPLATDTLILIGDADDWTPPGRCQRWVDRVDSNGRSLALHVFPGALHGFDTTVAKHIYAGHQVGGDPQAAPASEAEVRRFLAAHLGARGGGAK
ncbi:dienelactone hydrolase family protein [Bradyrhizobium sp. CCGB12]|uniref:dienelactone hydrolase family protein n=1 Tax=Bradyrhizobium sp. CCGB12 TaxID=2949632 RepID=UPI0035BFE945